MSINAFALQLALDRTAIFQTTRNSITVVAKHDHNTLAKTNWTAQLVTYKRGEKFLTCFSTGWGEPSSSAVRFEDSGNRERVKPAPKQRRHQSGRAWRTERWQWCPSNELRATIPHYSLCATLLAQIQIAPTNPICAYKIKLRSLSQP